MIEINIFNIIKIITSPRTESSSSNASSMAESSEAGLSAIFFLIFFSLFQFDSKNVTVGVGKKKIQNMVLAERYTELLQTERKKDKQ